MIRPAEIWPARTGELEHDQDAARRARMSTVKWDETASGSVCPDRVHGCGCGRAGQRAGNLCARRPFNVGWNPSAKRGERGKLVVGEKFCHGHCNCEGWRRRRFGAAAAAGTAGLAGCVLFVCFAVIRAVVHTIGTWAWADRMRHGTRRFDRNNASLHGQREDQDPYHEESDKRTHVGHSTHAR